MFKTFEENTTSSSMASLSQSLSNLRKLDFPNKVHAPLWRDALIKLGTTTLKKVVQNPDTLGLGKLGCMIRQVNKADELARTAGFAAGQQNQQNQLMAAMLSGNCP